ncbi:probable ubiquitin-conjugating enzyme E2 26 [Tanacetum coccineum]
MESSAVARYIPRKSLKRVFPGSSSSAMEQEVPFREIIDVDMDEDRNDVVFIEGKVGSNKKMKGAMGLSLGSGSSAQFDSKEVAPGHFPNGFTPGSNNFFDLDDYVFDDDYSNLQAHFDNMDLPTGIEAPISWLPDLVDIKKNIQSASAYIDAMEQSYGEEVPAQNMSSSYTDFGSGYYFTNNFNTQIGSSTSSFPAVSMDPVNPLGVDMPTLKLQKGHLKNHLDLNDTYLSADMLSDSGDVEQKNVPRPKSSRKVRNSSSKAELCNDDVSKKFEGFKKFDTVMDHSDHLYTRQNSAMKQASYCPPKNWAKRIQEEWKILEKDLPDTIFVRVYESRMDLLRAVIIGAEGTPYHDGLFVFDVCFPSTYPHNPPHVKYHSGGLRINPNLYNCGKVCLSLLNTWSGGKKEMWIPGSSTMLQVLVSIQGLILNTKPYFNEPGWASSSGSIQGEKAALNYNENTLILSLKTMVYTMRKQPKHFEDLVVGHFRHRVRDILMACKAYTEGVQVGSLVRGGVQDVDEGEESCSYKFKTDVVSYIKVLIDAFKSIGAKEAEEFLFLSEKKIPPPANQPAVPRRTRSATHKTVHTYHGHGFSPSLPYIPKQPPPAYNSYNPNPPGTYYPNPPGTYYPGTYYPPPPMYNPEPSVSYDIKPYDSKPPGSYDSKPGGSYF